MPFKVEHVTVAMNGPDVVEFIGSNQKLHGVEQMLRAHVKACHMRVVNTPDCPEAVRTVSRSWIDKVDTIEIEVASDGMVSFGGEKPDLDYYRILPV
jgi:hypothetical protein